MKIVDTMYNKKGSTGRYHKITVTETIFVEEDGKQEDLGKIMYLRPFNQVRREKHLDFDASTDGGRLKIQKRGMVGKVAEFGGKDVDLITYFYEHRNVTLEQASKDLGYKNKNSLRSAIVKANAKFLGVFNLSSRDNLIVGERGKGYSPNPHIRLDTSGANKKVESL